MLLFFSFGTAALFFYFMFYAYSQLKKRDLRLMSLGILLALSSLVGAIGSFMSTLGTNRQLGITLLLCSLGIMGGTFYYMGSRVARDKR